MKRSLLFVLLIQGIICDAQTLLTVGEVFDFEVGDEFHTKSQLQLEPPNASRQTILEKAYSNNNDTVFYTIERDNYSTVFEQYPEPHLDYFFYQDTIIKFYSNLDSSLASYEYNSCIPDTVFTEISVQHCDSLINEFHCIEGGDFEPDWRMRAFGKGIGRVKWVFVSGSSGGGAASIDEKLFYYKKNGLECGIPDITTSVANMEIDKRLIIYPNPAEDFVQIELENYTGKYFAIQVFDTKGKLIHTYHIDGDKFDVSNLPRGLYILKIEIENEVVTRKLIMN